MVILKIFLLAGLVYQYSGQRANSLSWPGRWNALGQGEIGWYALGRFSLTINLGNAKVKLGSAAEQSTSQDFQVTRIRVQSK